MNTATQKRLFIESMQTPRPQTELRAGTVIKRDGKHRRVIVTGAKMHFCNECGIDIHTGEKHVKAAYFGRVLERICIGCERETNPELG